MQQHFRLPAVEVRTRDKVRADHLKTVATGFIAAQHHGRCLDRLLDNWQLALVYLEINELVRFRVLPGQFLFDLALELLFRQSLGFVQAGCTFEAARWARVKAQQSKNAGILPTARRAQKRALAGFTARPLRNGS